MRDMLGQFQSFFESLTAARKIMLLAVLGVILAGMAAMIYLANRETWTPLYSNVSNEDAATIKEKLDKAQIPVQIGPGGRSILVP
ncbi:MAG TPA: flagellar M-ring protein FliF, partial [bacterium]|nr:flagellar M-ring protein FliF [bacterium]